MRASRPLCLFECRSLRCARSKTSLIKRYTEGIFTPNYKLTIGVDFAGALSARAPTCFAELRACLCAFCAGLTVKTLEWDDENTVNLQLWDVAGHERFGTMTRVYYKYAIAAVIVFDLQRHATFEAVLKWREDVNNKVVLANDEPIPCILLANKCDLEPVRERAKCGMRVRYRPLAALTRWRRSTTRRSTSFAASTTLPAGLRRRPPPTRASTRR